MLRIALLISILALFGDCMDMGKRKLGGISINEPSEYGTKEKEAIATKENAQTSKDPPTSAGGQNEAIPSPKKPSPKGKLKSDFGLNLAKAFPRPVPKGRRGKEKVGEKISVMNTAERIEKMDIAQDKAKMEIDNIDTNAKPKQNEDKAPTIFPKCADNVEVEVELDRNIFRFSTTLDTMMEDLGMYTAEGTNQKLPVSNVSSTVMREVIEWCEHHKNDASIEPIYEEIALDVPTGKDAEASAPNAQAGEVAEAAESNAKPNNEKRLVFPSWDENFLDKEWPELVDIILAANYLNIKLLLTFATTMVDNKWINGKTPQEIRKAFGVEEPYPPGHPEWARVEKENEWEESDEEREARHAKEREEEEERERKEEQKRKEEEAERLHQEQLQQQQNQEQQPQ
uniref:Putative gland protein G8H07 n=1 Tax=Heterodera glycines TaxID=51029 RepID=Q86DF9_HETGL|nr:putative gland protein G8H07 [Heterodera glycines]